MTEDKYKLEVARQRGVIQAQEKEIERLQYELRTLREQQEKAADDLRNALKAFLLGALR